MGSTRELRVHLTKVAQRSFLLLAQAVRLLDAKAGREDLARLFQ